MEKLDKTIKIHFSSIQNRDLDKLLETVDKNSVVLILPNGNYSNSYTEYKKVNAEWFLDNDWKIEYENGKDYSFQYFLTLIFKLSKNEWKLVFDQNTIIK